MSAADSSRADALKLRKQKEKKNPRGGRAGEGRGGAEAGRQQWPDGA